MGDTIFYSDKTLKDYESAFEWDKALLYLEKLFNIKQDVYILNSMIGLSWYSITEGPFYKRKYNVDESELALDYWEKYISKGLMFFASNPSLNFICGYTLYMDGFLINSQKDVYEMKGIELMKNCSKLAVNMPIKIIADNFLQNIKSKNYIPITNKEEICKLVFNGESLLDNFFCEIYSNEYRR